MAQSDEKVTTLQCETRTVMQGFHVAHEVWLTAWPDVVIRATTLDEARRWLYFIAMRLAPAGNTINDVTFTIPEEA